MNKALNYYEISALSAGGSKQSRFTYHSAQKIEIGRLVQVYLGKKPSLGVVVAAVNKPEFQTKQIASVYDYSIPAYLVELATWMSEYYGSPESKAWQTILPSAPQTLTRLKPANPEVTTLRNTANITLTAQQKQAINAIENSDARNFLLHGVASSGKTQVYIELAKLAIANKHSAIILVPEISLTPQVFGWFKEVFGAKVLLTHSGLTTSQRRMVWQKAIAAAEPLIIVGPRSALLTPVVNLGLIVIDEAHDTSYKQDQTPRYFAPTVAAKLAAICGAKLVLGSATPSVSDIYLAKRQKLKLVEMSKPVFIPKPTHFELVDLRDRQVLHPSSNIISKALYDQLKSTLDASAQSIIFLNRRGTARMLVCANCGWVANCPNCHIPLTWHADKGRLICHWCGYSKLPPVNCPKCHQEKLRYVGTGTKRVEAELAKLFPKATIARIDRDSFKPKTFSDIYTQLENGKIDILIGTQMITKGLDLPQVSTVGVILADQMLYLPDYTSSEKTFQLLNQVKGRAGRRKGAAAKIVIQTYSPDHPAIRAVIEGNFQNFVSGELSERAQHNYPPFTHLLKLWVRKTTLDQAQKSASSLSNNLKKLSNIEVIGPAPSWRETMGGKYMWQVVVKSKSRKNLQAIVADLPAEWSHDLEPIDLL